MTPEDILQSGQLISAKRLTALLARYGFTHKRTTGSHIICTHTVYSDEIVGLVQGTTDIVYQKNAAQACLRVQSRMQQHAAPVLSTPNIQTLPDGYEYYQNGNQLYIRSTQYPIMGVKLTSHDTTSDSLKKLDEKLSDMHEWLNAMENDYEFTITHNPDGSLHLKHLVYDLEDVILPFGSTPQSLYPQSTFEYLVSYTGLYDVYMTSFEYEDFLKRNNKTYTFTKSTAPNGVRHYQIKYLKSVERLLGGNDEYDITISPKGRMDAPSIFKHVLSVINSNIEMFEEFKRSGMIYTDLPDNKMRCTHEFMEIDFTIESPYVLRRNILDILKIVLTPSENQEETFEFALELKDLSERLKQTNDNFKNLQHLLIGHLDRWKEPFSAAVKRLMSHGYTRQHGRTADDNFATITFSHDDPKFRDVTFKLIHQRNSNRKTFIVVPYKKMVDAMNQLADECDTAKRAQSKPQGHALMQQNKNKPAPLFQSLSVTALGLPTAQGVDLGYTSLSTNKLQGRAKMRKSQGQNITILGLKSPKSLKP